jgi:hypothetical protein
MVQGNERQERLEHQYLFLRARGLTPPEMEARHRHLSLLERLAGKDPGKFDPRLVDRLDSQLEKAAMERLKATGLVDEWLLSWERRSETASVDALVPTEASPRPPAPPIDGKSTPNIDGNSAFRSLDDKLAKLEQAVRIFSESVASAGKADEQRTSL